MFATEAPRASESVVPAVLLGVGMGAFVDGIVVHHVLGWHHMLSGLHPAEAIGTLRFDRVWDGLFDVFAWLATAVGIVLLWRAALAGAVPGTRRFVGGWLAGFALFNVVEGAIDLLELNALRAMASGLGWNLAFLTASAVLLAAGVLLARPARAAAPVSRSW